MSFPKHVVIVSYDWVPRNAISVHRIYAWARYWSAVGVRITILTAHKRAFDEPLDLNLPNVPGVEIVEINYETATSFVSRLGSAGVGFALAKKAKGWLTNKTGVVVDPRAGFWKAARPAALALAKSCDVVVSSFGPAADHLIANDMKASNPDLLWVADYRDLWSQRVTGLNISERTLQHECEIELATVGKRADLITTVSHDLVRQLQELHHKSVTYAPNGFDIDREDVERRVTGKCEIESTNPIRIVYTGIIYPKLRDPTPLFDVLASLRADGSLGKCNITVDFYGSRIAMARELARNARYAPFIRIKGHVPRKQALSAQQSADFLLLLESPEEAARGVLTGKLFEYMVSGRPILCVGSRPDFEIGRVLSETGTGWVMPHQDVGALRDMVRDTINGGGLYDLYRPDLNNILAYSRERLSMRLLDEIKSAYTSVPTDRIVRLRDGEN